MNIAFLLEDTSLSDETRAVLALADAMTGRGHAVRIVTTESAPTWRSSSAEWVYVEDLGRYVPQAGERVIATSDVAKFAIVEDVMYRKTGPREHEPLRVLLIGPSQNEAMGLNDGYGAVAHARWFHQKCDLVRASPWAPSREEPLDSVQEFHVALSPDEMARLIHSCDIAVVPYESDVFSLAPMESLAAGLACVFTDLLANFDAKPDYARFAPAGNAVELGERLIELLESAELRATLSSRGREVAEAWRAPKIAEAFEQALLSRA